MRIDPAAAAAYARRMEYAAAAIDAAIQSRDEIHRDSTWCDDNAPCPPCIPHVEKLDRNWATLPASIRRVAAAHRAAADFLHQVGQVLAWPYRKLRGR